MPSLYGKSSKYIEDMMLLFRKGERKGTVMNRIAKGYSEADIKLIASYFGKLANK
jgi:sulfide dehydrogenase cytochrome subunit